MTRTDQPNSEPNRGGLGKLLGSPEAAIFLTVFIDLLGFGLVIPLVQNYAKELGLSGWQLGVLLASYSFMQLLFAPLWGRLSDRIGRRPVILFSVAGSALSFLFFTQAFSLPWLFASRIIGGIMSANISAAQAYMADITPPEQRARSMGLLGAAFGLGFIFGPPIGGLLSSAGGPLLVGLAGFALALINVVQIYFRLPESHKPGAAASPQERSLFAPKLIAQAFTLPGMAILLQLFFTVNFATASLESTFILLVRDNLGFRELASGLILGYVGVVGVLVQGGLMRRISGKVEDRKLLRIGYSLQAVTLALMPFCSNIPQLLIVVGFYAVGGGLVFPTVSSIISRAAPPTMRGSIFGVTQGLGSLARVVAPLSANIVYDFHPSWPYLFGAFLVAFALLLSFRIPPADPEAAF